MPVLKNPKHERFAQELARGLTLEAAYTAAGYAASRKNAQRLKTNEGVRARVSELQSNAAEKATIDAAWVLDRAAKLHDAAMEAKAFSAAARALDLIGKHVTVQAFREQMEHRGFIEYRNLSDEEIEARIAALTGGQVVPRLTAH